MATARKPKLKATTCRKCGASSYGKRGTKCLQCGRTK